MAQTKTKPTLPKTSKKKPVASKSKSKSQANTKVAANDDDDDEEEEEEDDDAFLNDEDDEEEEEEGDEGGARVERTPPRCNFNLNYLISCNIFFIYLNEDGSNLVEAIRDLRKENISLHLTQADINRGDDINRRSLVSFKIIFEALICFV